MLVILCLTMATYARNSIYRDSVILWENTVKGSPHRLRAHGNLGQALSDAGFYERALAEFQMVLSNNDGSLPVGDVYLRIGVVYDKMGSNTDAMLAWQTGLRYAPRNARLMSKLAIAFMNENDYDAALPYAVNAAKLNPRLAEPLNTLGEIYLAKGEYDKSSEYCLRAIELEPGSASLYSNAAIAYAKAGKYDLAYRYMSVFVARSANGNKTRVALQFMQEMKQKSAKVSVPQGYPTY